MKKNEHKFNINGMKVNDWFMGCEKCWYQLPKNEAGYKVCPNCGTKLTVHNFTIIDELEDVE